MGKKLIDPRGVCQTRPLSGGPEDTIVGNRWEMRKLKSETGRGPFQRAPVDTGGHRLHLVRSDIILQSASFLASL